MTVAIIVPLGGALDDDRLAAWDYVRRHYHQHHPDWPIVVGTAPDATWSKPAAVSDGVAKTDADRLILADADLFVGPDRLRTAIDILDLNRHSWVVPQTRVRRLSPKATKAVYAGAELSTSLSLDRPQYQARPGGGLLVCTRTAYERAGGFDPRFVGWGFEDLSFAHALATMNGNHVGVAGILWHLWHPSNEGTKRADEMQLAARYRKAAGDPIAMQAMIDEGKRHASSVR